MRKEFSGIFKENCGGGVLEVLNLLEPKNNNFIVGTMVPTYIL